ncbi:MAG TPA: AAA family ATPase, partial [bacterium]|nr:AAA family ATPase [bacterium]
MRLKRLELSGFKTFAERTVIEFASQITGIVGPNGSGKSNIFDAVRWALGEGSLRSLRSVRTEDIIFAGTERRRPLGMTEVTLTLDNEDGSLTLPPGPDGGNVPPTPLAFAEVTVTRRAMRNAESEYFINGLPCRLRDIQSMFLGTGLGGHTYALITQGEVDRTLDATPEERRMLLEEAAGLAKYKRRRHDAERRMAAAESTLLRVTDVLAELDVQTEQLAAQAETAERYQAQTRELRALELSLQVDEVRRSLRAQRRVREQLEEIAARRRETEDAVRAIAEQREALDRRVVDAGREWEQIQRTQVDLTERRAAAQAALELIGERLRGVDTRRQRLERERARCRDDAETLGWERAALAGADRELIARRDRVRQDVEAAAARLSEMEATAA